jgi:hypothetical protein
LEAHADIARGCLRYLRTCQVFLVEPASATAQQQIVKEFHTLFPYVHEYWSRHLLDHYKLQPSEQISPETAILIEETVGLLRLFARQQKSAEMLAEMSSDAHLAEVLVTGNAGMPSGGISEGLPAVIQQYLQFRQQITSPTGNQGMIIQSY